MNFRNEDAAITGIQDRAVLCNGVAMPWLGFGTFQIPDGREAESAVRYAIETGYRSVDTASVYGNEKSVGQALRASGLPREDIFITTKVWNADQGFHRALDAFETSRQRLALDVIDLYLVHWPVAGKYKETWKALEQQYAEKKVRAIGVSNFMIHHLKDLLSDCKVTPMVNQIEFHPYLLQPELLDFCREHHIRIEAWSPLTRGRIFNEPALKRVSEKHHKTPAQVLLRWDLQHGVITIPKSARRERIAENAAIFDFTLDPDDMAALTAMNRGERFGPDPDHFSF